MAIFRKVETSFWTDPMVQEEMTPDDKFFYLYLMTNPKSSMIGIYTITKKQMAFDLGYSPETVNTLIDRFQDRLKLICYNNETREIAVLNWAKTNLNNGGKPIIDCVKKELSSIKDVSLISKIADTIENEKIKVLFNKYDPNYIEESTESIRDGNATITQRGEEKEKEKEKEEDKEKDKEKDIDIDKEQDIKDTNIISEITNTEEIEISDVNKSDDQNIFDHFMSKDIVKHRQLTKKMRSAIAKFCKENPHLNLLDIKQGIDHYDEMLKSKYVFCNYVWGIEELFSRTEGITKFLDDGVKWLNYKKWLIEKDILQKEERTKVNTKAHNFDSAYDSMESKELENLFRDN